VALQVYKRFAIIGFHITFHVNSPHLSWGHLQMIVTQTPGPVLETAEIDISSGKHRRVGKKSRVCEVLGVIMLVYIIMCEHSFSSLLFCIPYRIFLLTKTCWLVCRMICHCSVCFLKLVCKGCYADSKWSNWQASLCAGICFISFLQKLTQG
jgi:hypothetical protein